MNTESTVTEPMSAEPTDAALTDAVPTEAVPAGTEPIAAEAVAAAAPAVRSFADLGVLPETVEALDALGITAPFPIQVATIPVALSGADVIGQAKTGTGKTLAFGIPVLQRVSGPGAEPASSAAAAPAGAVKASSSSGRRRRGRGSGGSAASLPAAHGAPQALVVVPTRELAVQVTNDLHDAGKARAIRVHALYGGRAYEPQVAALREGIDIAVGTPGRLLDLARQSHLELGDVRTLVLDEADEMLDLGFLPDVERIIAQLPAQRQTMLFSATMPGQVISLARQYMNRPTHIRAADPDDPGVTVKNIAQYVYRAHSLDKVEILARILQARGRGLTMIFARTKRTVAKVAEELADRHFAVAAVHGDLGQGAREQALRAFRNGKIDVLVATDVAARGIDVEGVTHVINFQCPEDEKVYTHRTGRTGRAGAKGTAVTLVDWDEVPRWNLINKALGLSNHEPAEVYSTSPQLYSDLDIPESVKGMLPRQERVREGLGAEEIEDLGETGRGRQAHAAPKAPRAERAERAPRKRSRTRRGIVIGPSGAEVGTVDGSDALFSDAASTQDGPAGESVAEEGTAPTARGTNRRRSRRSSTRKSAAQTGEAVLDAAAEAESPIATPSATVLAAEPAGQATAATAPRARKRTRSRSSASGGAESVGGSVKLAPGSLAAPSEVVPAAPSEVAKVAEVAEPVVPAGDAAEAAQPAPAARKRTRTRKSAAAPESAGAPELAAAPEVLAQPEPLAVETAEPAAPKAPRKRAARKSVAAEQTPVADVVSAPVADEGDLNAAPVANPRRTQVKPVRVRKAATRAAGAPNAPALEPQD